MQIQNYIREVPDFPIPGIPFKDITPLLANAGAFQAAIDALIERCAPLQADVIVSAEARGFLLAAPIAYRMAKPLIPIRKQGKLPHNTHTVSYQLEYGEDTLEIHQDAITPGQSALIVDDLLATGGTIAASAQLVQKCGGTIAGYAFLIELAYLNGRTKLQSENIVSLITY